tara:strand:+ start:423 stop:872 length:450 start_codon:yes stop_codon:yes gene_type:complete
MRIVYLTFFLIVLLFKISCNSIEEYQLESKSYFQLNLNDTALKKSILRGEIVYLQYCINCHKVNGCGGLNIPPLQNSDFLMTKISESVRAIKYGQNGEIYVNDKKYNGYMPPMGLSNGEISDVMNYILNSWGNNSSYFVTSKEVEEIQK